MEIFVVLYAPRGVPAGDAHTVAAFKTELALSEWFNENVGDRYDESKLFYNGDLMVENVEITE